MTSARPKHERDQGKTAFTAILEEFCGRTGALGVALVDTGGETVDYAGRLAAYDIRIAAAECELLLTVTRACSALSFCDTRQLMLRGARRTYLITRISPEYSLVILLPRGAFNVSQRALAQCAHKVTMEAGFAPPSGGRRRQWVTLEVKTAPHDARRPTQVLLNDEWLEVEILGRLAAHELSRGDVAYRARLRNGAELTVVREPFGRWYREVHW
jgi:hypothetical protein